MPEILMFVEDAGQSEFLQPMILRVAEEAGVNITLRTRSARGGYAKVLGQLQDYVKDLEKGRPGLADGLLVAVDANCRGYTERRDAVIKALGNYAGLLICAIPDPHVERWYLLDSEAFKKVLGRGCSAPDAKCEKERYKNLLNKAVEDAGVEPLLGGIEYATDLVENYDINRVANSDASFGHFVSGLRNWLNEQRRNNQAKGQSHPTSP